MADHSINCSVKLVIRTMKSKIADALLSKVQEVDSVVYTNFDKVRLLASDFNDYELPAVQLIDVGETVQHQNVRARKSWQIALELLMKPTVLGEVSQQDLWNLQYEIERKIFQRPNFGIPGVIHMTYLGSQTDLHLLEPYYFARIDLQVDYYEALVRRC